MTFQPSHTYRRNLERIEPETQAGAWRLVSLVDSVSEKRFLQLSLKSKSVSRFLPSVLLFRGEAASTIAPDYCADILSTTVEGDRLEILTDDYGLMAASDPSADTIGLVESIVRTLARFDAHGFDLADLTLESIGLSPSGEFVLLPNAYALPGASIGGPATTDPGTSPHAPLLAKFLRQLIAAIPQRATIPHVDRLVKTAEGLSAGEIPTMASAFEHLFGKPLPPVQGPATRPSEPSGVVERAVATARDRLVDGAAIIVVTGKDGAAVQSVLDGIAHSLSGTDKDAVRYLDEWDLFAKPRRKSGRRTRGQQTWIIDDIDEKALPFSDLGRRLLIGDHNDGNILLGVDESLVSAPSRQLLQQLPEVWGQRFHAQTVATARAPARGTTSERPAEEPSGAIDTFKARTDEERSLLELLTVARFSMPLDLVLSVFPSSPRNTCATIQRLNSIGVTTLTYRREASKDAVSIFVRTKNRRIRRRIYKQIPRARRRKLHRTLAVLAEQNQSFPTYFLLYHCLEAGETDMAATHAAAYLRESKPGQRHPLLLEMCEKLADREAYDTLPFSDRVGALYELAMEMFGRAGRSAAEKLLLDAKVLIDETESEQKLRHAPLLTKVLRALADRREARGEFKQALAYLGHARDQFQSVLPMPDQAHLLNDIGWMQYRLGDYEKSMECCRLSLNTLDANQHPVIVAQALNLMGVVHFNTSRYDEAISYYEQAAQLRERANDENALAASFNNLALAYQSKGEYQKALDYYNKSLDLKERQNNKEGTAGGYLNLALLYLEAGNFQEAERRCRESLVISEELGNAQLAADNYITLGDIAFERGDLAGAEHHYQKSRKISKQLEAINEEMGALRRLSTTSLRQGRLDAAREYAERAFELVRRIGSRYEEAQIEVILGDLEHRQKHDVEALAHYEKASSQYMALSKYRMAATVLSKIGLIHAETGNSFEAKHHLDRAHDLVRADIGHELPEEIIKLRQALRTYPTKTQIAGPESQKLLMAFYDLTSLFDYAQDHHEFLRKMMDSIREIMDPLDSVLVVNGEGGRLAAYDGAGERRPELRQELTDIVRQASLLGGVLDSRAPDAVGVRDDADLPDGANLVCVPLKAMGEDLGTLLLYLSEERVPLSKDDINFFTWVGRQLAGGLKLMLTFNPDLARDGTPAKVGKEPPPAEGDRHRFENLIGKSESMKAVFRTLEKVKGTDSSILILGESGTGKSVLARAAHYNSPRANRPFQEIHCAQIPHNLLESELFGHERGSFTGAVQRKLGLCEVANGGTLFLDDINVIPPETQTKLLSFIESKSFIRLGGTQRLNADVRIIAASNEDLEELCRVGKFREDLYYRLKVILIHLPPLRERKEDMLAIALDYLKRSCTEKGIPLKTLAPDTVQLFQKAPWRGNVRELQNVLERIVVLSDENIITTSSLPEDFLREAMGTTRQSQQTLDGLVEEIIKLGSYSESKPLLPILEAMLAKKMVDHVEGKSRAASRLGISKPTLYARLRDYDKML